jgi:hypothetical protein
MAEPNKPENEVARLLSSPASLMQSASLLFAAEPDLDLPTGPAGPKKETARVGVTSGPAPETALIAKTTTLPPNTKAAPKSLCWILLGASAAILLIEIWNYVS